MNVVLSGVVPADKDRILRIVKGLGPGDELEIDQFAMVETVARALPPGVALKVGKGFSDDIKKYVKQCKQLQPGTILDFGEFSRRPWRSLEESLEAIFADLSSGVVVCIRGLRFWSISSVTPVELDTLASMMGEATLYLRSDAPRDLSIAAAKKLSPCSMLYFSIDTPEEQLIAVAQNLNASARFCLSPHLPGASPDLFIKIAKNLNSHAAFYMPLGTPNEILNQVAKNLNRNALMCVRADTRSEALVELAGNLNPESSLCFHQSVPDQSTLIEVVKKLKPKAKICLCADTDQNTLVEVAKHLNPYSILGLPPDTDQNRLVEVAKNLNSNAFVTLEPSTCRDKLIAVAKNLCSETFLVLDRDTAEDKLIEVAKNLKPKSRLYLRREMDKSKLIAVAKNLRSGSSLCLRTDIEDEKLIAVAKNLKPGSFLDLRESKGADKFTSVLSVLNHGATLFYRGKSYLGGVSADSAKDLRVKVMHHCALHLDPIHIGEFLSDVATVCRGRSSASKNCTRLAAGVLKALCTGKAEPVAIQPSTLEHFEVRVTAGPEPGVKAESTREVITTSSIPLDRPFEVNQYLSYGCFPYVFSQETNEFDVEKQTIDITAHQQSCCPHDELKGKLLADAATSGGVSFGLVNLARPRDFITDDSFPAGHQLVYWAYNKDGKCNILYCDLQRIKNGKGNAIFKDISSVGIPGDFQSRVFFAPVKPKYLSKASVVKTEPEATAVLVSASGFFSAGGPAGVDGNGERPTVPVPVPDELDVDEEGAARFGKRVRMN